MKTTIMIAVGIIALVIIVFGVTGTPDDASSPEVIVKDYEGMKLDDLDAFRENSIKGLQYVNVDEYSLKIGGLVEAPYFMTYPQLQELHHIQKLVTLH
ncbi:MAG: hypothetical protein WCZ49_08690, partial [Mesotoga sp.]